MDNVVGEICAEMREDGGIPRMSKAWGEGESLGWRGVDEGCGFRSLW